MSNTTIRKPYELKAERNEKLLNTFVENSTVEYQTLVNALLAFWNRSADRKTGGINVSIGQRANNCFNVLLMSYTNKPNIVLGNWNNTEPKMLITIADKKINNMICSLNLTLISDLETVVHGNGRYTFTFRYDDTFDYQIEVVYNYVNG